MTVEPPPSPGEVVIVKTTVARRPGPHLASVRKVLPSGRISLDCEVGDGVVVFAIVDLTLISRPNIDDYYIPPLRPLHRRHGYDHAR